MIKKTALFILGLSLFLSESAFSATTAQATITFSVNSIDAISVSGDPGPLNVIAANAGSPLATASDSSTTYSVTTNNSNRKITGFINPEMPTGLTLTVTLAPPPGATSIPNVPMLSTPSDLVTGISNLFATGLGITYTLNATPDAAQVSGAQTVITYTITAGT